MFCTFVFVMSYFLNGRKVAQVLQAELQICSNFRALVILGNKFELFCVTIVLGT